MLVILIKHGILQNLYLPPLHFSLVTSASSQSPDCVQPCFPTCFEPQLTNTLTPPCFSSRYFSHSFLQGGFVLLSAPHLEVRKALASSKGVSDTNKLKVSGWGESSTLCQVFYRCYCILKTALLRYN